MKSVEQESNQWPTANKKLHVSLFVRLGPDDDSASRKCLIRVKSFSDFASMRQPSVGIDPEKIASVPLTA